MIVLQRGAEVARGERAEIGAVLAEQRPVEPEPGAQLGDRRGIGRDAALGQQQLGGIARDQVDDQEDDGRHHPDQGERDADAPEGVIQQAALSIVFARSAATKQSSGRRRDSGLLRFARNDGVK